MNMRLKIWIAAISIITVGCGGGSSPTSPNQPAANVELVSVSAVSGDTLFFVLGQTRQLQAIVRFTNGSSQTVTSGVTWQSGNPTVASVSSTGFVTALTPGSAGITATYQGVRSLGSWVAQVRVAPDISGTWRGTYSQLINAGVGGIITWTVAPNGNGAFVGTFVVDDDFSLGRVTGTFFGRFRPYPNEQQMDFAFSAPRGNMTREPTCTLLVSGLTNSMETSMTLTSRYLGNWCDGSPGSGFAGFDGSLNLQRQ